MSEAFDIRQALERLAEGNNLEREEMASVMRQVMSGGASEAQIGGLLMALRVKGESLDEITGAAEVMRNLATGVPIDDPSAVDIVGTGGDGANLFNVSTASCFVVAAAGGHVAKHGNRSVSSKSGSADLLEAAGVKLGVTPEEVRRCVDETGVGFMFAPAHHGAMKYAVGPRKDLGVRTIFNVLGPLTNPARVKHLLIGVFDQELCRPVARVLGRMGADRAMVVHSNDGLDEISLAAPTHIAEWRDGAVTEYGVDPESLGVNAEPIEPLVVNGPEESLALIRAALSGDGDPRAQSAARMIALNSGAALYLAGLCKSHREGVSRSLELMRDGEPARRLERLAELSSSF